LFSEFSGRHDRLGIRNFSISKTKINKFKDYGKAHLYSKTFSSTAAVIDEIEPSLSDMEEKL
jgi:hypothetical protein